MCGGCHVRNTSEITAFKILSCSAIASGIRRIEAVTGNAAIEVFQRDSHIVEESCKTLSCQPSDVLAKISENMRKVKDLEKEARANRESILQALAKKIATVNKQDDKSVIVRIEEHVDGYSADELKFLASNILNNVSNGVIVLDGKNGNKHSVVVVCSKSAVTAGYHAGNIANEITSNFYIFSILYRFSKIALPKNA